MNPRVVVVDDDDDTARLAVTALTGAGYQCEACGSARAALAALEERGADVLVAAWDLPQMGGIELLRTVRIGRPSLPVIVLTGSATVSLAVTAMREGASDCIAKPYDGADLCAAVGRVLEKVRSVPENHHPRQRETGRYGSVIAESAKSRALLALVRRVAPSRSTVLIQGESGTGKEVIARLLHYCSDRASRPFVAVNCKAFADGVLESELFGHEKGSFTSAAASRSGCFERAAAGTLFLDEIGEISADFQAKLLRVLQEGEELRVGGSQPHKVDIRIVAATSRILRDEVAAGRFREALFFRLNVIPVCTLPLRERREDILPLARHFLAGHGAQSGRQLAFAPEAEQALLAYPWPGNIRELQNVVERAVVLANGETIVAEDLLLEHSGGPAREAAPGTLQEDVDRATAERISAALASTNGRRAEAARALGIDRTTLYRLMKRLGL
jgi:two-component system NtrC family response regulator